MSAHASSSKHHRTKRSSFGGTVFDRIPFARFLPFAYFSPRRRRKLADLFAPRRPRRPLLRVVLALAGLGLLAVLLVFGLIIGAAMLAAGLVWRVLRRRGRPLAAQGAAPGAIEGEYRVVRKPALPSRLASIR